MARTSSARQDAIETAVRLIRTQGYAATGLTQILEESGAPKGSFYFHFPGGKDQLALEALKAWGHGLAERMRARIAECDGDAEAFVRSMFEALARDLESSGYQSGCVAASLSTELTAERADMAAAVARVIDEWIQIIADGVEPAMASRADAVTYATTMMGALSGLRSLARAQRSTAILETAQQFFVASLPARAPKRSARTRGR